MLFPLGGLVDTGASCTAIDPTVIQDLQISPDWQGNADHPFYWEGGGYRRPI